MVSMNEAKNITKGWLRDNNFNYSVKGRTVSFSDLGYGDRIFIKVVGWQPDPRWEDLDNLARENGFRVEA